MQIRHSSAAVLAAAALLTLGTALAAETPASPPAPAPSAARVMEPEALDLVKKMGARLAATESFVVRTRSSLETPGGTGQFITFYTDSVVAVKRPHHLAVEIRGDAPPFDFYYDGKTMTAYEPTRKLYASAEAPKTLDELVPFAAKQAGILLPFADLLYSDAAAVLTKDATSAFYAGYSVLRGQRCEHVVIATPTVAGQVWIDAKTDLPCQIAGTLLDVKGQPRFSVEFYDWKPGHALPNAVFEFQKPKGADPIDFRAMTGAGR